MTDKQEEAISILNRLLKKNCGLLEEEEYFLLLDFIIGGQQQIQYIPYYPWTTEQCLIKHLQYEITCKGNTSTTAEQVIK